MNPIQTLLVDDHAITRMGLKSILATRADIAVIGEAEDGADAIRQAPKLKPDVVVMDLMMPGMDGATAVRGLKEALPSVQILILTTFGTADGIAHALESGAVGAVMKNIRFAELVKAIHATARGERFLSPEIEQILSNDPPVPELSDRQAEILSSIARGLSNEEIARELGISARTVKEHLNGLFTKIGAANRAEAVAIAFRKHLLRA